MSDPLGLAASIIAIAATGFTVAQGLYKIADGIGSAGQEVRVYADEIDAFSKLLKRVRSEVLRPCGVSLDEQSLLQDIIDICDRVLLPLNCLQTTLNPLLVHFRNSPGKIRQFGLRIQWIFNKKNKLLFYRDVLSGQHRLLDTTLELMCLQANRDRSPQNIYVLKLSLENSMAAVSHSLNNSNWATHVQSGGFIQQPTNSRIISNSELVITEVGGASTSQESPEEAMQQILQDNATTIKQSNIIQNALIASLASSQLNDGLSEKKVQNMNEQIERDLNPKSEASDHDICEDMRAVSRKVFRLASKVLLSSQQDAATQAIIAMPASPPLIDNQTLSGATLPSSGKSVNFLTPNGVEYEFPYDEVRTWEGISHLIQEIYQNSHSSYQPRCIEALIKCHLTLVGPNGRILPRLWEKLVEPNIIVKLEFNEYALNS